jgi:hypothetical protein
MEKGFIDREKERTQIENLVNQRSGKLVLFGGTGEGKSSLLNYMEYLTTQGNRKVIKIEGTKLVNKELFVEELLHQVELKIGELPDELREKLKKKLEELNIIELREKKTSKEHIGLEGKLFSLISMITGKYSLEEGKEAEKEYYVTPRIVKLERIVSELLPTIFEEIPILVVADNLEKCSKEGFHSFLTEVANLVPVNVLLITTGSLADVDSRTIQKCYDVFDFVLQMDLLNTKEKLKGFVVGRMNAYCKTGHNPPDFDDKAVELLLNRTGGNLRETFRYCSWALQKFKKDISEPMMLEAMAEVDAPRFQVMDEYDQKIISILAQGLDNTAAKMTATFCEAVDSISLEAMRDRLEKLVELWFASRRTIKAGNTYATAYNVLESVKMILAHIKA